MRKLLVFLIVFAIGLAILLWFEGWLPGGKRQRTEEPPPPKVESPGEFTEVPVESGDKQRQFGVVLQGKLDHTERDEALRRRYRIVSSNLVPQGEDAYDLEDFQATVFDPETDEVRAQLDARKARARVKAQPLGLDESYPITLNDVEARLEQGLAFVPLVVRVPLLEGRIGDQTLHSEEAVDITGVGLKARGTGLDIDGRERRLALLRDALIDLDLEQDPGTPVAERKSALLTSKSGLVARVVSTDPVTGVDSVEITASERAVLELRGPEPVFVSGDRIVLEGEMPPGKEVRFVPERVRAEGSVKILTASDTFTGERGELTFTLDGEPAGARLEGRPTVELPLAAARTLLPQAPERALVLQAEGAGPLVLTLGEPASFEFHGPATVRVPELAATLTAQGGLRGAGERGATFSRVTAYGGVSADAEGAHIETDELDIVSTSSATGEPLATLTASGRTRANGTLADGRAYELEAEQGADVVRASDRLYVPRADGARLRVLGERGFTARADHMRDLDVQTRTFSAEGAVQIDNALGSGRGDRLLALENGAFELAGEPARVDFDRGFASARWIDFADERVTARENATAHATLGERTIDLAARWIAVEQAPPADPSDPTSRMRPVTLDARGDVRAKTADPAGVFELGAQRILARGELIDEKLEPGNLEALGAVLFSYRSLFELHGCSERLTVDGTGRGRLDPLEGDRVQLSGRLPRGVRSFELEGDWAEFDPERLEVHNVDLTVEGTTIPLETPAAEPRAGRVSRVRAVAGHMTCDPSSILFTDGVFLTPAEGGGSGWSLDAANAMLGANRSVPGSPGSQVGDLLAWGSVIARLSDGVEAHGEALTASPAENRATLIGEPAFLIAPMARWESPHFEWNLQTSFLRTGKGRITSVAEADPWTVTYEALEQVEGPDETIQVMREPIFQRGEEQLRASWFLFWVDRAQWARLTGNFYGAGKPRPDEAPLPSRETLLPRRAPSLFSALAPDSALGSLLREFYLEGNIELFRQNERFLRAAAVYIDYADGHGWIEDVDIRIPWRRLGLPIRLPQGTVLKIHTAWLRHSLDGSFRADEAVITTCDFEEPHYTIKSGDLRITPDPDDPRSWDIVVADNAITFPGRIALPLPKIVIPLKSQEPRRREGGGETSAPGYPASDSAGNDEGWIGQIEMPSLSDVEIDFSEASIGGLRIFSIGTSTQFGTFVGTTLDFDTRWLGEFFSGLLGGRSRNVESHTSVQPAYLNKRGPLLAVETSFEEKGLYAIDVNLDQVYDQGEDLGLVRVPEDERSAFRGWYHSRGRYWFEPTEWIDLAFTYQTDPGVQAEFWAGEYLDFPETQTYLHYRKAEGQSLLSAQLGAHVNDFETESISLPSVNYLRGRAEIGTLGSLPLIYTANTNAGYFARYDGNPQYFAPYPDGTGDRQALRFDTLQALEAPIPLGALGLILTPGVGFSGEVWSEGLDPDTTPAELALLGELDLATTFWRVFEGKVVNEITPQITLRGSILEETFDGPQLYFDPLDIPKEGQFVDFKLRTRFASLSSPSFLDVELFQTYAWNTPDGEPDGWLPFEFAGEFLSSIGSMPFGMTHDGRYDFVNGQTVYSRTYGAIAPHPTFDIEAGYNSATQSNGSLLYDAATIGARWRISSKWEVEGKQTMSATKGRLAWEGVLRRFGHDFVLELEVGFIDGQGNTFAVNFVPLLAYRSDPSSLLDRWFTERGQY